MSKPTPILHITTRDAEALMEGGLFDMMERHGYLTIVTSGRHESIKILTPAKMKRADYRACVNAAKAILKSAK